MKQWELSVITDGYANGTNLKDHLAIFLKLNIVLPYNSAALLLSICSTGLKTYLYPHKKLHPNVSSFLIIITKIGINQDALSQMKR